MIKYREKIVKKKEQVPVSLVCDICKKEYFYSNENENHFEDDYEIQEFLHVRFTGGYGSVFGDGNVVACDICQNCLQKLIGKHIRNDESEW